MLPVAILAGGLATRLLPATETIPKALLNVAGKSFIDRQLSYLSQQEVTHVVICVGHLGNMIRDAVGDGEKFGIKVSYSEDCPNLLGTGGAITKASPLLGDHFFVLYGDSFVTVNFSLVQEAFQKSKMPALMTIFKNDNLWDKSNVLVLNGQLLEYNKHAPRTEMTHIDYGLAVISASVLKDHPFGLQFDLANVYQSLSLAGKLAGLEVYERFYEIGSNTGLREAEDYFLRLEKK